MCSGRACAEPSAAGGSSYGEICQREELRLVEVLLRLGKPAGCCSDCLWWWKCAFICWHQTGGAVGSACTMQAPCSASEALQGDERRRKGNCFVPEF